MGIKRGLNAGGGGTRKNNGEKLRKRDGRIKAHDLSFVDNSPDSSDGAFTFFATTASGAFFLGFFVTTASGVLFLVFFRIVENLVVVLVDQVFHVCYGVTVEKFVKFAGFRKAFFDEIHEKAFRCWS